MHPSEKHHIMHDTFTQCDLNGNLRCVVRNERNWFTVTNIKICARSMGLQAVCLLYVTTCMPDWRYSTRLEGMNARVPVASVRPRKPETLRNSAFRTHTIVQLPRIRNLHNVYVYKCLFVWCRETHRCVPLNVSTLDDDLTVTEVITDAFQRAPTEYRNYADGVIIFATRLLRSILN